MLFPTLGFLLFFLVVAAAMAVLDTRFTAKKAVLVVASYYFYAQWDWRFCFLLAGSSLVSYLAGQLIDAAADQRRRQMILGIAVALHLGLLGAFKYFDFFISSANQLARLLGLEHELPFIEILLPVGISFFTLHGISYITDVYRRDVAVCRNPLDMLLYMSFFPQLVAGPIVRAAYFLPQLARPSTEPIPIGPALLLILVGLFKKVVIANYVATGLVDPVFSAPTSYGGPDLLLATYGYAVQIYCDFSAYSDMAIALAALLGFRFPANFNQPYRAQRLREFWQRWHISLSAWLRDYLYIPLGGSRKGPVRTYFNLILTMLLGGLWHGASWNFLVWGGLHGGCLAAERAFGAAPSRSAATRGARVALTFLIVLVGWVFFRAPTLTAAVAYLEAMSGVATSTAGADLVRGLIYKPYYVWTLAVAAIVVWTAPQAWDFTRRLTWPRTFASVAVLWLAIVMLFTQSFNPFIYFIF